MIIRSSTLPRFHTLLKNRKYRELFSSGRKGKPGSKGPSKGIIVEMKRGKPRFMAFTLQAIFIHQWLPEFVIRHALLSLCLANCLVHYTISHHELPFHSAKSGPSSIVASR